MNITEMETKLLQAIAKGMDAPGSGWLHEMTPFSDPRTTAGVLGSLVVKGLVTTQPYPEPGLPTCSYVEITKDGLAVLNS